MRGYTPKPAFDCLAKKSFASETQVLDFAKSKESAAVINDWVEAFSNNKIKQIVDAKDLSELTTLVLVNGIYFKAGWYEEFRVGDTTKGTFFMDGGEVAENVSFMIQRKGFSFADIKELDATAVQLSFTYPPKEEYPRVSESDVYMLIILPNRQRTRRGLCAFEDNLKRVNFDNILKQFRWEYVNLKIPKFKIESDVKTEPLKEALRKVSAIPEQL